MTRAKNPASFRCATCGQVHPGLPLDYGCKLPDEVYALDYVDGYLRSRSNHDFCTLDDARFFIRGVIALPMVETDDTFCWGVWLEVSKHAHDAYAQSFRDEATCEAQARGTLANSLRGYAKTLGLAVDVTFMAPGDRPRFVLPSRSRHALAVDQRRGITSARHHQILERVGFFEHDKA